jgi:hypothetical protein
VTTGAGWRRGQYDAVDPDNQLEDEFEAIEQQRPLGLGEEERNRLLQLGADLETAWSHPAATMATRKRFVTGMLK